MTEMPVQAEQTVHPDRDISSGRQVRSLRRTFGEDLVGLSLDLRSPGIVPSATILIVNSTRYKIKGAQAIALTDTTSRILVVARVLLRFL